MIYLLALIAVELGLVIYIAFWLVGFCVEMRNRENDENEGRNRR